VAPLVSQPRTAMATSGRFSSATAFQSRKGNSFATSTAARPTPYGSLTVGQSGGAAQPANGASSRASKPAGITSSASPIANAACGNASMGASARDTCCQAGVPCR